MVTGTLQQSVGQWVAAFYLRTLQFGLGVQVSYYSGGVAAQLVWACPLQPSEGESPTLGLDVHIAGRAWKIPVQYDAAGNPWPPAGYPQSEDYLEDSEGIRWYVVEGQGAIINLDGMSAIWQIHTDKKPVHRVH